FSNWRATSKSAALSSWITACRSSFFLLETRSWSPWICACTPLGPSSRIFLLIFLATSWEMPCTILPVTLNTLPELVGCPMSSALSEMPRLTSFSLKTSMAALQRSSVSDSRVTAFSPDHWILVPVPRKSNRLASSLAAWFSALSTSWRSTLLTTSNDEVATCYLLVWGEFVLCRYATRPPPLDSGRWRYVSSESQASLAPPGCPSGQRELTVNQPALPTEVRILHPALRTGPDR